MALEREAFEALQQAITQPNLTEEAINSIIQSFETLFGNTLSDKQKNSLFGGAQLTEAELVALPERTPEIQTKLDQKQEAERQLEAEREQGLLEGDIQRDVLVRNPNLLEFAGGTQEDLLDFQEIQRNQQLRTVPPNFVRDVITQVTSQLGPVQARDQEFIVSIIREAFESGLGPSAAVSQIGRLVQQRQTTQAEEELQGVLTTEQGRQEQQQEAIRQALAAGGEEFFTPRLLARLQDPNRTKTPEELVEEERQLAQARTDEEATRIAALQEQDDIRVQQEQAELTASLRGEITAAEERFPEERRQLAEELRGISEQELELAQPEIERRLQELGILRSGQRIKLSEQVRGRLLGERQRILAGQQQADVSTLRRLREEAGEAERGVTRQDILFARGIRGTERARVQDLSEQFRQEARGFGLREADLPRAGLEQLTSFRTGVAREDILGGRERRQRLEELGLQQTFASREAQRARAFESEQRAIERRELSNLSQQLRSRSRSGAFGQLFGGVAGAGLGFLTGGRTGALLGGGLGGIFGGAFGGGQQSQLGQSLFLQGLRGFNDSTPQRRTARGF